MYKKGYIKKNVKSRVRSRIENEREWIMTNQNVRRYRMIDKNCRGGVMMKEER